MLSTHYHTPQTQWDEIFSHVTDATDQELRWIASGVYGGDSGVELRMAWNCLVMMVGLVCRQRRRVNTINNSPKRVSIILFF